MDNQTQTLASAPPRESPPPPPSPQAPRPASKLFADPRAVATMKASAIWNAVGSVIDGVFGYFATFFIGGIAGEFVRAFGGTLSKLPVGSLIKEAVWAAIYGALIGFILSNYFAQIKNLNKQYLRGKLNTFFKLLFYPSVAIAVLLGVLASSVSFYVGFMPFVIILAGVIVRSYIYAKMVTRAVGSLYEPPV